MTPHAKAQTVKALARDVGFDLVGITHANPIDRAAYYRGWLAAGYAGTMGYLHRNVRLRLDPAGLLPGARSIVCAALAYKRSDGYEPRNEQSGVSGAIPVDSCPTGRVAQYARGHDYHVVLHHMLDQLIRTARDQLHEPFEARVFVDTGPVLERELAAAAGLGWIGRNTCLLNGRLGSYLLLGEAVTTLDLHPDPPAVPRCGRCTRCVDTCPTRALVQPHMLDARRCIAYLTIEHRGEVSAELRGLSGDWVFGCDLCQQVCPYNARAPLGTHPEITADRLPGRIALHALLEASRGDYRRLVRGTATGRARIEMLRRNAGIVLANSTHS